MNKSELISAIAKVSRAHAKHDLINAIHEKAGLESPDNDNIQADNAIADVFFAHISKNENPKLIEVKLKIGKSKKQYKAFLPIEVVSNGIGLYELAKTTGVLDK